MALAAGLTCTPSSSAPIGPTLAEQFGCSQATIHKVVTRRAHADID
jgi:hypothetical protein